MRTASEFSLDDANATLNSQTSSYQVVSLNPDAIDEVGHFLAYDDSLYGTFQRFDVPFISFCNRAMKEELLRERPYARATLTTHSWDLGNYQGRGSEPPEEIKAAFRSETIGCLDSLVATAPNTEFVLYIYCGSLYHAEQLLDILELYSQVRAVITLFWLPFANIWEDGFRERWKTVLQQCSEEERIMLTVTTVEEQEDFYRCTGYFLPVSPHPSTTIDDAVFFQMKAQLTPQTTPEEFLTVFPGNLLKEKGYELTFEAIRFLTEEAPKLPIRSLVRVSKPDKVAPQVQQAINQIKNHAETIEGGLSRAAFIQLICKSNIIVLPYRPPVFAKRTSGLLIDAIYCGVPVVVMAGTWLGNFVSRTGCGIVVTEPTGPAIARAIKEIAGNYQHYRQMAVQAGTAFFQSNSWVALAASIIGESPRYHAFVQERIANGQVATQGLNSMSLIQSQAEHVQRNGNETNGKQTTSPETLQPGSNETPDQEPAGELIVPAPSSTISSARLATGLLGRISRYYSRWPLGIAVLAAGLNTIAMLDDLPFRSVFSGSGTLLLLFLIGHAASKADVSLQTADRAQEAANYAQTTAEQGQRKATSAFKKGQRAVEQAKSLSDRVNTVAHTAQLSVETANRAVSTARFSVEATNRTTVTVRSAVETAKQSVEKAESALDRANQAAITADAAVQACDRIEQEMSALEQTFDQTVKKSLNHTNVKLFQPFERQLTSENLEIFTKIWLPTLGLPLNSKALGYLAHHICLCEDACSGRLATTVQDMLLRILVARSVQNPELSVLEVGSLFGINLAAIYDLCRDYFKTVHLTAVDPLDGYYGQSYTDLITQVPITRKIFEHNMRQVDVPVQDITLIQGLSTEDMVLERVGLKQYNLLIIDGDHSYAGVKFDFDHYLSAMDLGGYIIFDDYGSSDWPDVAEFVDNEVKPNPCVEFVGASWRTAVFKVIRRNLR